MSVRSRLLILMRHATAQPSGASDLERRLTPAGTADAVATGSWLAERTPAPERALVSAAVRTRQTWEALAEGAGWDADLATYDEGLYTAGAETVLDLLRGLHPATGTVLVLGHNPTIAELAQRLDDGDGDDEAANAMALGYPPAATTVFAVSGEWADLGDTGGRVVAHHAPAR
ncbi:SixA phosphatase family protein [Nocardioides pantholopis]|uniref:SixA phosphatase family protein n=1 Tax=Nocardioides pantholopis TaxID=2483798 RepID=UPI001F152B6F|nr:histidine phosphatase family protein [Nocardioides pantholopis]